MSKRVLLVDLAKSFGGAEVRVLTLARALQARGMTCEVALLDGGMLHQRVLETHVGALPLQAGRGSLKMLTELHRIMALPSYDVVDAHNVQSILWGMWAARLAGVPRRVATIHSDFAAEYPGLKGKAYAGVLALTRPVINRTIAVTEPLAHKTGGTYIPNAVAVPEHPLQGRENSLGFAPDDFIVGVVGRLVPVKGHRYLIDALTQLDERVKLMMVGTGPLEDEIKRQVDDLGLSGRVSMLGFRDDVLDVMRGIDCLCLPSLSEALPYVLLEAASLARPLVATGVGGVKTLLRDRETALMVEPENPAALAQAIQTLADNPALAAELGANAYEMVKGRFSVGRMVADTLRVYDL